MDMRSLEKNAAIQVLVWLASVWLVFIAVSPAPNLAWVLLCFSVFRFQYEFKSRGERLSERESDEIEVKSNGYAQSACLLMCSAVVYAFSALLPKISF